MAAESHRKARAALTGPARRRDELAADHRLHLDPDFMTSLLDRIDRPQDLHALSEDELQQVAQEVRELLIDTVGEIGGHFGANLGSVRDRGRACTRCWTRRATRSCGTSATRPTRTRS